MKPMILPAFILLIGFIACKSSSRQPSTPLARATWQDSLDVELQSVWRNSIMPGFSVSLVRDDKILFSKGYGYADLNNKTPFTTETVNCVASISKTFIGLAIMQLVEAGKLRLDEPINNILPYKIVNPHFPEHEITVRHLVTHTSTLTQEFDPEDTGDATIVLLDKYEFTDSTPEDIRSAITYYQKGKPISLDEHIRNFTQPGGKWYTTENFLQAKPGTKFDYSNLDAAIAARIVEIKSGITFEDYTRKHIFEPLGMRHTSWKESEIDATLMTRIYMPDSGRNPTRAVQHPRYAMTDYPAGGLKTNAADLSKYLIEMMKGYGGNGRFLREENYRTLFDAQLPDSCFENRNDYPFNDQYSVGIFWAISPTGYRLHNGGSIGVYSFLYFDPATKTGALSFCNLPVADFGKVRDIMHKYQKLSTR